MHKRLAQSHTTDQAQVNLKKCCGGSESGYFVGLSGVSLLELSFFKELKMTIKENQLHLANLIDQKSKIQKTIYADSYGESKEDVLRSLDVLIEKRAIEAWELI